MAVSRLRLFDFQASQWSDSLGGCPADTTTAARLVNRAQERLLTCREAGDTGWYGCYAEMVFNVDPANPYITLPRGVARLIRVDICDYPYPVRNQFYEYLAFGSGHWPKLSCSDSTTVCAAGQIQGLRRNLVSTMTDLTTPGYTLRFYPTDTADVGKKILVSCKDANGVVVRSTDNSINHDGVLVKLASPSSDLILPDTATPLEISAILGLQKDTTVAPVNVFEVNTTTGDSQRLLSMEPTELVAGYSRYYFESLPTEGCCPPTDGSDPVVQVKAMVKLDLVPVRVSTDYLLIQSIEALIAEAQSARYDDMDEPGAMAKARERHARAIGYLNGMTAHYEGKDRPSVQVAPFGSAHLNRYHVGSLI